MQKIKDIWAVLTGELSSSSRDYFRDEAFKQAKMLYKERMEASDLRDKLELIRDIATLDESPADAQPQ